MSSIANSSFDVHPNTKGSYRRRAEDITRALQRLRVEDLSSAVAFLIYYFACEKLAKIIIGISNKKPASRYFDKNYSLHINNISSSCKKIGVPITDEDINWIFVSRCDNEKWRSFLRSHHQNSSSSNYTKSARSLRNKMVHDIGPTHSVLVREHASFLISKMKDFLSFSEVVIRFLTTGQKDGP